MRSQKSVTTFLNNELSAFHFTKAGFFQNAYGTPNAPLSLPVMGLHHFALHHFELYHCETVALRNC
ncbi:hypothetical protein Spb1_31390 [Planctopirus ephydatiae]|uniref:Uncharacterized protein n=1 Tax=Planctopirus ephydatiae TaxID=2528019 RepID=A0A518GRH4_9PLAN|nr:hypothetical protein Spb1_31390 [Planctopirus ephydatiae]